LCVNTYKLTRLNKYLSQVGYCSRREADKLIEQGRVTINNQIPEMGTKIGVHDIVRNIIDYLNYPKRIFPIGRLDKPSEGLIFLTSDGDIVNKILRARNNHEKEYIVTVNKLISDDFIKRMSNGIPVLDTVTRQCKVEQINKYTFSIILTQGLNRQIRRMCEHLGYEVIQLKRVRIMNITLDIPVGEWRYFTEEELKTINADIEDSGNTEAYSMTTVPKHTQQRPNPKKTNPKNGNRKSIPKTESKKQNNKKTK